MASPPSTSATAPPPLPTPTTFVTAPSLVARGNAALTTPYVFSSKCTPQFLISDGVDNAGGPMIIETFLYQNRTDQYTSCQPPGLTVAFDNVRPTNSVYRGAVCPSGWHGFQLGERSTRKKSTGPSTWSTALCCKSGDSLVPDIWGIYGRTFANSACASSSTRHNGGTTKVFTKYGYMTLNATQHIYTYEDTTTSQGTTYTVTGTETTTWADYGFATAEVPFGAGRLFYPPMSMEWVEDDNKSLVPPWPTLKNDMLVPTWRSIDGESLFDIYENRGRGPIYTPPLLPSIQTKIAYPIIGVLAGIILIMVLVPLWRMWRRKRRAASQTAQQKWKDELNGRVPEEELEMADLGTESEVGRNGLGRSEVGSEVNLNGVPNTLPVEGIEEGERRGRRQWAA